MNASESFQAQCAARGLVAPRGVMLVLESDIAELLGDLMYRADIPEKDPRHLTRAFELLEDGVEAPPTNLVPLMPVDDSSIACVIAAAGDYAPSANVGNVVRWHLGKIAPAFQGLLLDTDAESYLLSVADELRARKEDLPAIKRIAENYRQNFIEKDRRPRGGDLRPVQLACQNVIIGLAAMRHDSIFDGLRVPLFLSCEVPHLATHESNRALAALILCDAFQNGGTMEIRFGESSRPHVVPPGLRRFGRTLGIQLGSEDDCAITPAEARELFLAVTPMPPELWIRVITRLDQGLTTPERICYTLLAPIWSAIELDYLLATSQRAESILEGGAAPDLRRSRLAELESSRAALMCGMFFRRIGNHDSGGQLKEARIIEDARARIEWSINGEEGSVAFIEVPPGKTPWSAVGSQATVTPSSGILIVIPRSLPTPMDFQRIHEIQSEAKDGAVALLVPADISSVVPPDIPLLVCPDRLGELDIQIEAKLQSSRICRT